MLEFDEAKHEYRADGVIVPSVTQVISPLTKLWVNGAVLEKARQEGKAIHSTVELDCAGTLDEENLPEWLRPYLKAWRDFRDFTGFELVASEKRMYSPLLRIAGTLDLDGVMTNFRHPGPCVLDIKRSLAGAPAIGVQLAGYASMLEGARRRYGLQLKSDGTYRLQEYTDPQDRAVFLSCITLYRWRQRNE
jgi:hypothetical protein